MRYMLMKILPSLRQSVPCLSAWRGACCLRVPFYFMSQSRIEDRNVVPQIVPSLSMNTASNRMGCLPLLLWPLLYTCLSALLAAYLVRNAKRTCGKQNKCNSLGDLKGKWEILHNIDNGGIVILHFRGLKHCSVMCFR